MKINIANNKIAKFILGLCVAIIGCMNIILSCLYLYRTLLETGLMKFGITTMILNVITIVIVTCFIDLKPPPHMPQ